MKICGVIAEYNPFHLGHAYHLARAREDSGCDYLIAAMSGSFTQRGEPALADKWSRAACALRNGADLVVELPARFAVRSADLFARGGVELLSGLGTDCLCFGAESSLDELTWAADALEGESDALSQAIRAGLSRGETLARARGEALEDALGLPKEVLSAPNNALAMEYIRANSRLDAPMALRAVPRRGNYHGNDLPTTGDVFASASAVRAALLTGRGERTVNHLPPDSAASLMDGDALCRPERLDNLLLHLLRQADPDELSGLCDAGEGVERRLCRAARSAASRAELIEQAKCKRYTYARLSRLCAQAMLGMKRADDEHPRYVRVLGFRRDAASLLRHLRDNAVLPLCADAASLKNDPDFRMDARATDLFGLGTAKADLRRADRDYSHPPIIV